MSPHLFVHPKMAEVGDCVPTPNQASGSYDKFNDHLNLFQQMFIKHLLWAKDLIIVCVCLRGVITIIKNRITGLIHSQDKKIDIEYIKNYNHKEVLKCLFLSVYSGSLT